MVLLIGHGRVSESEDSDYLPPYDVAMHSIYDLPVTSVNRSPPISRDRTKYILQNSDPRRSAPPMSEDDEYTGAPGAESVSSRQNGIHGDCDQDQDSPLDNPIGTSTGNKGTLVLEIFLLLIHFMSNIQLYICHDVSPL